MLTFRQPLIAALALAWGVAAQAATYYDSSGTAIQGFVPIDPAAPQGGGTGPLGTAANPLHTTGGAGGSGTGAYSAARIGTADSTILTASTASKFLDLVNASASATVCINLGATATISG